MGDADESNMNPASKKLEFDPAMIEMITNALKPSLTTIEESIGQKIDKINDSQAGITSEIQALGRKHDQIKGDLEAQMKTLDNKLSENDKKVERMMKEMKGEQQVFNMNLELRFSRIERENCRFKQLALLQTITGKSY